MKTILEVLQLIERKRKHLSKFFEGYSNVILFLLGACVSFFVLKALKLWMN